MLAYDSTVVPMKTRKAILLLITDNTKVQDAMESDCYLAYYFHSVVIVGLLKAKATININVNVIIIYSASVHYSICFLEQ